MPAAKARHGTHYILVGPKGKRAGLANNHQLALQLNAIHLTATGRGGGIVPLALPRTEKEWGRLEALIKRGYWFKEVQIRRSYLSDVRNAVLSGDLMLKLAFQYHREKGQSRRARSAVNREFAIWITKKLADPSPNAVKNLLIKFHPELLNRTSVDWWKKQLNQRVRKIKK